MTPEGSSQRPATRAEIQALVSPVRLRMLRLALDRPRTNAEFAGELGLTTATTHYHVRRLVDVGFLRADPEAGKGRAIPYHATGKSWELSVGEDPQVLARAVDAMLGAYVAELQSVGAHVRRAGVRLRLPMTEQEYDELNARVIALLDEYKGRPRRAGTRPWSLLFMMHEEPDGLS